MFYFVVTEILWYRKLVVFLEREIRRPEMNRTVNFFIGHGLTWTSDRKVWTRVLTEVIVLCPWVRHFTLTVPLAT